MESNVNQVVHQGRSPATLLNDQGTQRTISQWGQEILTDLLPLAAQLDAVTKNGSDAHQQSIRKQQQKLQNPGLTPSGRILQDMQSESVPFFRFAMNRAVAHRTYFQEQPLSKAELEYFTHLARQSIADQNQVEQLDEDDFDTYLDKIREQYLALVD